MQPFALGGLGGDHGEALAFLLLGDPIGDVHRAPDRAGHRAMLVERHPADPGDPMDRPRATRPCARPGTGPRLDGAAHRRQDGIAVVRMQQRHVRLEAPSNPPGGNPNNASSRSSHTVAPVAMSQRHVPSPPASNAARKCSVRSRAPLLGEAQLRHLLGRPDDGHDRAVGVDHGRVAVSHPDHRAVSAHDDPIAHLRVSRGRRSPDPHGCRAARRTEPARPAPNDRDLRLGPAVQLRRRRRPQDDPSVGIGDHHCAGQRVDHLALAQRCATPRRLDLGSPPPARRSYRSAPTGRHSRRRQPCGRLAHDVRRSGSVRCRRAIAATVASRWATLLVDGRVDDR